MNKHCPLKVKKLKKRKTPWFDDLARKLRNAKTKASKRGDNTAKFFLKLLKNHLRKSKRKWISQKLSINNSKSMWSTIKILSCKEKTTKTKSVYTINEELMNPKSAAETLNTYFTDISGLPTEIEIDCVTTDPDYELTVSIGQVNQHRPSQSLDKTTRYE